MRFQRAALALGIGVVFLFPAHELAQRATGTGSTPRAQTKPATTTTAQSAKKEQIPPLSYVCPMPQDSDVVLDKPGKCPKCGMALQPVRLDTAWSCTNYPSFIQ